MFDKNDRIKLISQTETQDSAGFLTTTETSIEIYAHVDSVTGTEFYQTGMLNIKPSIRAVVWIAEYAKQKIVEYEGERYSVYRTYKRNSEEIELYLEDKAGNRA